jgi:hypothetical protein
MKTRKLPNGSLRTEGAGARFGLARERPGFAGLRLAMIELLAPGTASAQS